MTWGMEWGSEWGGSLDHYDFESLNYSKLWKQFDYAVNLRKQVKLMADVSADPDAEALYQSGRGGIDSQFGDELDELGEMLGIKRNGMQDSLYIRAIKATYRKNFGGGDPTTLYDVVDIFTNNVGKITLEEVFPAKFIIWLHNLELEEQEQVTAILDGVRGLGIGAHAIIVDPEGVFQWSSTLGSVTVTRHWSSYLDSVPSSETAGFASSRVI